MSSDTWPTRASTGTDSARALWMPIARLAAPGPREARHTPISPLARAYPSAMNAATCSCRAEMYRRSGC